jgi:RNA methyltransferase, TrmH family
MKKITSPSHPIVKHLMNLRKEKNYREEQNSCLLVGNKISIEMMQKKPSLIKSVITSDNSKEFSFPTLYITDEIMKKITGVVSPEERAVEIFLPEKKEIKNEKFVLVLDKIQDPGNLGTLIRTAHGLNWDGIILTDETVDPFNDKALRAAKGSTFFIPLFFKSSSQIQSLIQEKKFTPYLADLHGKNLQDMDFEPPLLLILSSESQGVQKWTKNIENKITILLKKDIDSLNVAISGAILMYAMRNS